MQLIHKLLSLMANTPSLNSIGSFNFMIRKEIKFL